MSDAQTNTVTLPDAIDFNESDRKNRNAFMQLAETPQGTIYQGVVKNVTVGETSENSKCPGTLQFMFDLQAINERGKPEGSTLRKFVQIPVPNPSRPGHSIPPDLARDYMKFCREAIRAIEGADALPRYPRKVEGTTDQWFDPETNARLTKEEYRAGCEAVDKKVEAKIKEWFNKGADGTRGYENLKGAVVHFAVRHRDGRANISYMRNDAGDAKVIPASFVAVEQK